MEQGQEIFRLLALFQKHHVQYLIVGGLAINHYGYHRHTGDVDLYLKDTIENRQALINALDEAGYGYFEPLLSLPIMAGYCEILMDDGIYADLMTQIPGLDKDDFDKHLQEAKTDVVEGVSIHYLNLHHLLQNKKATGRPKDLLDIEELQKRNPEHGTDSPR